MVYKYNEIQFNLKKGGHSDTWMNLEGIILGEMRTKEEDTHDSTSMRYIRVFRFIETE